MQIAILIGITYLNFTLSRISMCINLIRRKLNAFGCNVSIMNESLIYYQNHKIRVTHEIIKNFTTPQK